MPITGTDIPSHVAQKILLFASQRICGREGDLFSCTLVCLHWSEQARRGLWQGRVLCISSLEQAQWFEWLATIQGSPRLTPVIALIRGLEVVQEVGIERSWLHLLHFSSTQHMFETWTLDGRHQSGIESASSLHKLISPHWGLGRPFPPCYTSYRVVRIRSVTFNTFSDILKLFQHFSYAEEFKLDHISWKQYDGPSSLSELAALQPAIGDRRRPVRLVRVRHLSDGSEMPPTPAFAFLLTQLFKVDETSHLAQSNASQQRVVQAMLNDALQAYLERVTLTIYELEIYSVDDSLNARFCLRRVPTDPSLLSWVHIQLKFSYMATSIQDAWATSVNHIDIRIPWPDFPLADFYISFLSTLSELQTLPTLVIFLPTIQEIRNFIDNRALRSLVDRGLSLQLAFRHEPCAWQMLDPISLEPTGEILQTRDIYSL